MAKPEEEIVIAKLPSKKCESPELTGERFNEQLQEKIYCNETQRYTDWNKCCYRGWARNS